MARNDPYRDRKKYHMAKLIGDDGSVSALCSETPKPINLKVALWTLRKEAVTCRACLRKLE